jgi:hypothetical protein
MWYLASGKEGYQLIQDAGFAVSVSINLRIEAVGNGGLPSRLSTESGKLLFKFRLLKRVLLTRGLNEVRIGRCRDPTVRFERGTVGSKRNLAVNVTGLAGEAINASITASQDTALLLEVLQTQCWQRGGFMELGDVIVVLMDTSNVMMNVRLDGGLMDDRLDDLLDMVVDLCRVSLTRSSSAER